MHDSEESCPALCTSSFCQLLSFCLACLVCILNMCTHINRSGVILNCLWGITQPQHYKIIWGGRNLWQSSPIPCSKTFFSDQVFQGCLVKFWTPPSWLSSCSFFKPCSSIWSHSFFFSLCQIGIYDVPDDVCCLLSYHYSPLWRDWFHLPFILWSGSPRQQQGFPFPFPSQGWRDPALTAPSCTQVLQCCALPGCHCGICSSR